MAKPKVAARSASNGYYSPTTPPRATFSSTYIPQDIWLYIARFIPSKTLRNLYSLNSLFLELALNERYKEVNFLQINQKTIPFLEHMRDTNLSSRVRRLRVNPVWFNLDPSIPKVSLRSIITRTLSFHRERLRGVTKLRGSHHAKDRRHIDALTTDLVVHFSNVTTFILVTRYWPHPQSLAQFLTNSWHAFGSNLRRLTINAPLKGFAALLPTPSDLVSLEDLTLRFSTDMTSDDHSIDTKMLTEVISPFLQQVAPRLRTLNLMSSALGDHSILFHALDHTPYLTSLSLNIGFYPPLLQDLSGLTQFLNRNTDTLKHIKLQPLETFRSPSVTGTAHDHFMQWMAENASNELVLSNLQTLVVLPSTDLSPTTRLAAATCYMSRSKDTLTNLILGEHCISFAELNTLVDNFAHRPADRGLKILHVKLISLNPQVFDLLAEKLVGLDDLDVKFNLLLPDVQDESPRPLGRDEEPTNKVIAEFLDEMAKRNYPKWRLYSLWIWQRSHMTTKTAHEILTALRPSIPSVRVIYRMDHTHHLHTLFN